MSGSPPNRDLPKELVYEHSARRCLCPDRRAAQWLRDHQSRTLAVARGANRVAEEHKVWFTSTESFAKVLSAGLWQLTGRAKSNLSRTLKTMAGFGLVRLDAGERGRIAPKVLCERAQVLVMTEFGQKRANILSKSSPSLKSTGRLIRMEGLQSLPEDLLRGSAPLAASTERPLRHSALVRTTHWIIVLSFLALLVSGVEILISHPRFYWGENGNVLTPALFKLPIPSSRSLVPTGYGYVLPDQNGWSRYLHFQSAWLVVLTGLAYVTAGFLTGHFRNNLLPRGEEVSWRALGKSIASHLRLEPLSAAEAWTYNLLQRLSYLFVIFILFPMVIWTGLAMSPAFTSAFPMSVTLLGGRQSARTIHFFVASSLLLFLLVHVGMVWFAGFRSRMRTMITGKIVEPLEGA